MGPSDRRADPAHDDKVTINRGQARHSVCGERGPCLPDSRSLLSPLDGETCWRASLDRCCLRSHASGARWHRYRNRDRQEQPEQGGEHRDGGPGNSSWIRPSQRGLAGLPAEEREPAGRPLGEIQLNGDPSYSLFRFPSTWRHDNAALSFAGQISYPGSNIPVASLWILRSKRQFGRATCAIGGAEASLNSPTVALVAAK